MSNSSLNDGDACKSHYLQCPVYETFINIEAFRGLTGRNTPQSGELVKPMLSSFLPLKSGQRLPEEVCGGIKKYF
jgi:hypothetical protein